MKDLSKRFSCPVELSLEVLGGKWKTVLLAHLKQGPLRYGELRARVPALSDKVLTERLRELAALGLVEREGRAGSERVRYALTARGETLRPALEALYQWGEGNAGELGVRIEPPRAKRARAGAR